MSSLVFITTMALGLMLFVASTETTGTQATFSTNLFSTIAEENVKKNVIVSPASIQTALALTYLGAEGNTATELREGLNLGGSDISKEQVAEQFGNLMSKMRSSTNATVKMANRIYVRNGLQIAPEFNDKAQRYFDSAAENVNFADNVITAEKINNFIETQTENRIQGLISSNNIGSYTDAILVNAIYFKATWLEAFPTESTTKEDFHLSATITKKVDMMYQESPFAYAEFKDLDAKGLLMEYIDTKIRMLVLLPNQLDGLGQLERQLKHADLTKLQQKFEVLFGAVQIPKFKIEFDISLQLVLKTLGMRALFSPAADFSSLVITKERISISEVVHKAFISVTEAGTETVAATGVGLVPGSSSRIYNFKFNVDHPFYFALLDDDTVYFAGHVADI